MIERLLVAACVAAFALSAQAQGYPNKSIRIVVPYPAGGSADLLPRIFAEKLWAKWGQPVLVENRPGAGGNIGAEFVYKAEPDGYTLFATAPGPLVVNQNLFRKLAFDPSQFVPVSVMAAIPNVLIVNPRVPVKTVDELIAYAAANRGKLNYGSQGNGTTSHLTAELFKSAAGGLEITHVPYKGSAPAMAALLAGEIDLMFDNLGVTLPHVKSGGLKALAVGSEKCRRCRRSSPVSAPSRGLGSSRRRRPRCRLRKRFPRPSPRLSACPMCASAWRSSRRTRSAAHRRRWRRS